MVKVMKNIGIKGVLFSLVVVFNSSADSTYYAIVDKVGDGAISVVSDNPLLNKLPINNVGWAEYLFGKGGVNCNYSQTEMDNNRSYSCASKNIISTDEDYPKGAWDLDTIANINMTYNRLNNVNFMQNITNSLGYIYLNNNELEDVNGLFGLEEVGAELYLHNNPYLKNIEGLSNLKNIEGTFALYNTDISDYTPLANLEYIGQGRTITIDPLNGDEVFPSKGAWCDNSIFLNLAGDNNAINVAMEYCNRNIDEYSNYFWAKYLNTKGSTLCNYSATELKENSDYLCLSKGMAITDLDYPKGEWQVTTANNINFSNNNINNTDFLKKLNSISGYLDLSSANLVNVDGLSSLTSVGGMLNLYNNSSLKNVDGLSSLKTIGGYFYILGNVNLLNVDGLQNLTSVGGNLFLHNSSKLASISGLSSLKTINGSLNLINTAVMDYRPLSNLSSVSGTITIDSLTGNELFPTSGAWCDNEVYLKLSGGYEIVNTAIQACNKVGYDNYFWAKYLNTKGSTPCNYSATELKENSDYLCLSKGMAITDLDYPKGEWQVTTANNINFSNNNINNTDFLKKLNSISGYLDLSSANLVNVDGLSSLTSVGGMLNLYNNSSLKNVDGLSSLKTIGGYFYILGNVNLLNVDGLQNLTSVGGNLFLHNSSKLASISGLSSLKTINGSLNLINTAVMDYRPLSNLSSVSGSITIDALTGNELFPTSGAWCDNEVYLKLTGGYDMVNTALLACGVNKEDYADYFWARYLNAKGSTACSASSTELSETSSYSCYNKNIKQSDSDYPDGYWSLTRSKTIEFSSNTMINVDFLINLIEVAGDLKLSGVSTLSSIQGLSNLTNVSGHVNINSNGLLKDLNGLNSLSHVGGQLYLSNNNYLNNISALSNLRSVGTSLNIGNTAVMDYSALTNLESVGTYIGIDALNGTEIFPSNGAWCNNRVYEKISTANILSVAKTACGH